MKLNEQNERQFLASMKPISLLLKEHKDDDPKNDAKDEVKNTREYKEPTWKNPYPNVEGYSRGGQYVIPNETSTIETKIIDTPKAGNDSLNFGNNEASHAKLEEKKNKTFYAPNIKYKTEQNATTIETTAMSAV